MFNLFKNDSFLVMYIYGGRWWVYAHVIASSCTVQKRA